MAGRDSNFSAPVATKAASRPYGEENESGFDHKSSGYEEETLGKKPPREAWNRKYKQQHASVDESQMQAAGPLLFRGLRRLAVFCGDAPVNG